jgi:hypothetical protein
MKGRHPSQPGNVWRVTIATADNMWLIFHAVCEDVKEVQAVCTEARHASRAYRIWINPPIGQVYSWD